MNSIAVGTELTSRDILGDPFTVTVTEAGDFWGGTGFFTGYRVRDGGGREYLIAADFVGRSYRVARPNPARRRSLGAIHAMKRELGLSDAQYRLILSALTGAASCADMDAAQLQAAAVGLRKLLDERKAVAA